MAPRTPVEPPHRPNPHGRTAFGAAVLAAVLLGAGSPAIAARPALDASADRRPAAAVLQELDRARSDAALSHIASPAHFDERYGVPTLVRATPSATGTPARPGLTAEQAARDHLTRLAPWYRLDAEDVRGARLRDVHDTGEGGIIVSLKREIDGVEVFRDEIKVLMSRELGLLAVSGYVPGRAVAGTSARRTFQLGAPEAIARALADFSETGTSPALREMGNAPGGYEVFVAETKAGEHDLQPIRVKPVLFHLPDELLPAWYIEVLAEEEAASYVVSARDGALLFRHDLSAADSYTYRVWADASGLRTPYDGPQGKATTPHPTGLPDFLAPSFVPPVLVSLANGPISTNDPWLPPGATVTSGNNVDAYADVASPDGFTAGDLRATTTGPNTFDRTYDTNLEPGASSTQRMASVTQLFYVNNWLHDWFYDAGFTESAGNAQASNYGRGGVEGDAIKAEAQDYQTFNNASMMVPADGASPKMQMYRYRHPVLPRLTVHQPALLAGLKPAGLSTFGFVAANVTRDVVLPNPNGYGVQSTTTVTSGAGPQWVEIAHVDGDASIDLVTANYGTNDVSVIRANGSGGFLPKVDYAMGAGPYTVETSDLNLDGLTDLICANFIAGTVSVRLGTGGGAFGAKTDYTTGAGTAVAVVWPLDFDVIHDLVTANYHANSVSVLLGNGSGGFGARVDYPTGPNPNWVAKGDVNGDGKADLVVANSGATTISVLLGTGTGAFGAKTDFAAGGNPLTLALEDLNGDGKLDVVTANYSANTLSVLLGDGAGGFGAPTNFTVAAAPVTVTIGELNGDGIPDVAVCSDASNSVSYLTGTGNGGLRAAVTQAVGTTPYGLAIGDVDGDGTSDLVSANFASNNLTILRGLVTEVSQNVPIQNSVAGRILLCDVSNAANMQGAGLFAGAVGVLAVNPGESTDDIAAVVWPFPSYVIRQSDGVAMKGALRLGRVNATMLSIQPVQRDGALDNQVVAHEWGHYLSNRLIGNASGLNNLQGGGLGEGWGDFCALLLAVRPEDAALPGPLFGGTYASNSYTDDSTVRPDNAYYFGARRYPYSTDFAKNPLTFQHIQEGVPLPVGPPIQGNASGGGNSGVHNTGHVWATMLWECYAELLRDTGRLTFAEARDRMRNYLVASLKLTPIDPTFVEARDAVLLAALANDPADHAAFCAAFARRGLGSAAVAPGRYAANNTGVVESFGCGGVRVLSASLDPEYQGCDDDGVTDVGERGRIVVRFRNEGQTPVTNASVGVVCSSSNVSWHTGPTLPVASLAVGETDSVEVIYQVSTNAGIENVTFTPRSNDSFRGTIDGAAVPVIFNRDRVGTGVSNFADLSGWTNVGWTQVQLPYFPFNWRVVSANGTGPREDILTTPSFVPSSNAVSFQLDQSHIYRFTTDPTVYQDGLVIELSTDDGATWTDIGASATLDGYEGTLGATSNPLAGRPAFVGHPEFGGTSIFEPVGAFAGNTCRLRVRSGFDSGDATGFGINVFRIECILPPGSTFPFSTLVAEQGDCGLLDVDPVVSSGTLSFALRGANPIRGVASFAFDLPRAFPVKLEVFDVTGRRVATLVDEVLAPGMHEARWNAPATPGIYFARLRALGETRGIRAVVTR